MRTLSAHPHFSVSSSRRTEIDDEDHDHELLLSLLSPHLRPAPATIAIA